MSYPRPVDVKQHKNELFASIVQYFSGLQSITKVEQDFRTLLADGYLEARKGKGEDPNLENIRENIQKICLVMKRSA